MLDLMRWAPLLATPHFSSAADVPAFAGISGGRTSAMLAGLLDPRVVLMYQNTGREHDRTLEFLHHLEEGLGRPIVWMEFRKPKKKGAPPREFRFEIVNYKTAARKGEPFDDLLEALTDHRDTKGLPPITPWARQRLCTAYLKHKTGERYIASLGIKEYDTFVGLRHDEPDRVHKLKGRDTQAKVFRCGLFDAKITKPDVLEFWAGQSFNLEIEEIEGNCTGCLSADTEIVTAEGLKPIGPLVGTSPELLIPKVDPNFGLSEVGHFVRAPIRSFGVQRLWRVDLAGHGRAEKTLYATAEHRWFLTAPQAGRPVPKEATTTDKLREGDRLRNLFRCPIGEDRGDSSRVGALRGLVFGDGTVGAGERPGTIIAYGEKDTAFRPLLTVCFGEPTEVPREGGVTGWSYYGVPNYWKAEYPNLRESRHYLMGWLAGYFAADGCVSEDGNCILNSAEPRHLEFVRSVCAILGVQCSAVNQQERIVTPPGSSIARPHTIYNVKLNRHHLTADFFWLSHHRSRVAERASVEVRRYGWTVKSVMKTDRVEEVFCATVEGAGAFGLADGLMTGNCFLKDQSDLARVLNRPETDAEWWYRIQEKYPGFGGFRSPSYRQLASELPVRLAIEEALRKGEEPPTEFPSIEKRRLTLLTRQEARRFKNEIPSFSCACESSMVNDPDALVEGVEELEEGDAA